MARVARSIRTVIGILLVTLTIDAIVSLFIPGSTMSNIAAAEERDAGIYDLTVPYHHDFRPNISMKRHWGKEVFDFSTDRNGFRTGKCAGSPKPVSGQRTVFVIGDSFTEGVGVDFEDTVAGRLACAYQSEGMATYNLGVASYSPVIYHRKLEAAVAKLGVTPDHLVVLLDISDIHNDALDYFEYGDRIYNHKPSFQRRALEFLKRNLVSVAVAFQMRQRIINRGPGGGGPRLGNGMSRWTVNQADMEAWGRAGLEAAGRNLDKIVTLCREWRCTITLVVYPWPDQVDAGDLDSVQVKYWQKWASERPVRFVNAFGPFFGEPKDTVLQKYFIEGDVHWTAEGHRLVFDQIRQQEMRSR